MYLNAIVGLIRFGIVSSFVSRVGVAFLFCFFAAVSLCLISSGVEAETLENKVFEASIGNGLKILVVERHEVPVFSAFITVGIGSVHEHEGNRGIAHFLEHMRFKGTEVIGTTDYNLEKNILDRIDEIATKLSRCNDADSCSVEQKKELEQRLKLLQQEHKDFVIKDEAAQIYARHGGVGFNAYTSKDLTSYMVSLPANKLELWVAMEADRMKHAVLREFYTEKEVILEERRRSYETKPSGMMYEALLATAFRVHPYRHPVIGWTSDIESITKNQTRDFMHKYYMPGNTVIALVGDVDANNVVELVERYFGDIEPGLDAPRVNAVEPKQKGERRTEVLFAANPRLLVGYHKPTVPDRDDYVFDILSVILGRGSTSRLYKSLILEQQLASSVSVYTAPGARYPNLFVVSVTPRYPHTSAEVEGELYAQLEKIKREGISEQELKRACKHLRAERIRHLRSNKGLASMLTHFEVVTGSWRYLTDYDDIIQSIGADEVRDVARRWLKKANRSVVTLKKPTSSTGEDDVLGANDAE